MLVAILLDFTFFGREAKFRMFWYEENKGLLKIW